MISEYLKMKIIGVLILAGLVSGKTVSRELLSTEDDIKRAVKEAKDGIEDLATSVLNSTEEDIKRAVEEAKDGIEDFATSVLGNVCRQDTDCMKYVAYCHRVKGEFGIVGQCHTDLWNLGIILFGIAGIVLVCSYVCWRFRNTATSV